MPGTPVLLRHDHFAGRAATRIERVLAVGRIFLAGTGLLAAYFDPSEIGHVRDLTYAVLLGYVAYSLAILIYLRSTNRVAPAQAWWLHGVDILWATALTLVSQGPISPYFLFFFFAVISTTLTRRPDSRAPATTRRETLQTTTWPSATRRPTASGSA